MISNQDLLQQQTKQTKKESIKSYLDRGGEITYICLCKFQYKAGKEVLDKHESFTCPKCGREMTFQLNKKQEEAPTK